MYCTHPFLISILIIMYLPINKFSTNHYYVLYPPIFLISILNSLLCIVPSITQVFSTNHYYVLYPSILLISILNKPLLCIVPPYFSYILIICIVPIHILISILNKPLLCIVPIHISHQYSQQTIIMYCTHPYFSSVFSTNHYYVLYPSIFLISILNKPLLCIVPIHITHISQHHYYVLYPSILLSTNHYYVLYPSILLISILNKPLLCIVPIHISHKYSQQTIIMYCTHPYYSSVFSTNHYYVLYPSILLISILNKSLLCIVPIHITHKYSQQTIIMYCTHPYYS